MRGHDESMKWMLWALAAAMSGKVALQAAAEIKRHRDWTNPTVIVHPPMVRYLGLSDSGVDDFAPCVERRDMDGGQVFDCLPPVK